MAVSEADFEQLEKLFPICLQDREDVIFSQSVAELLQEGSMARLLNTYGPLIKSLKSAATAISFCGWFISVAVALQYSISVRNRAPDFSPQNLVVQLYKADERYGFAFKINRWTEQTAPVQSKDRALWRNRMLAQFYASTVRPLVEALSDATEIQPAKLWGQFPSAFLYYVDKWYEMDVDPEIKERIRVDYQSLVEELDGEVFGHRKNPFDVKIRWIESLETPDESVRMKCTCCLYYCLEGGDYCYTCPRLNEEERAARRAQYRAV
jgi:ferric iron reductase protein FhuF